MERGREAILRYALLPAQPCCTCQCSLTTPDFQLASKVREQMVPFSCLIRQQRCIFIAQGPTACLPVGCFIKANLATGSTVEVLANPSVTQTVCITLQSPIQPNSLLCDTQEACPAVLCAGLCYAAIKKISWAWTSIAAVNCQASQKPQTETMPQYRYQPSLYLGLQATFFDLSEKSKLYLFEI